MSCGDLGARSARSAGSRPPAVRRPPGRRPPRRPPGPRPPPASLTARSGPVTVDAGRQRGAGQPGLQLEDERGPGPVRDGQPTPAADEAGHDADRILGLGPRPQREQRRVLARPGAPPAAGTTRVASPSDGQDQHGRAARAAWPRSPVSQGRSAPSDSSRASTPRSAMRRRTRSTGGADPSRAGAGVRRSAATRGWRPAPRPRRAGGRGRRLAGVVARTGQGRRLDVGDAHRLPAALSRANSSGVHQRATGRWCDVGPQVLADGDDVDTDPVQVGQGAEHLVSVSPMPDDEAGLGGQAGGLGPGQHGQAAGVATPRAAPPAAAGRPSRGCG